MTDEKPHTVSAADPAPADFDPSDMRISTPDATTRSSGEQLEHDSDERSSEVPAHYGDPAGEQWALESGKGLVDRRDLSVVRVSGPDRHTWLTSITSQILTDITPGESRELLILSPEGRIEHAAAVVDDGTHTWLVTEGNRVGALVDFLESMRFALRVDISHANDVTVFASVRSPQLQTAKEQTHPDGRVEDLPGFLLTWEDPWPGPTPGGVEYFQGKHPGAATPMVLFLVDNDSREDFAAAWFKSHPGSRPVGILAWEAVRIAAWRPRVGVESDERAIPAELDWLRTAVHVNKGCYRGQESIARVINLGRPPRRLTFLQLDGSRSELPEAGTLIRHQGRTVGRIMSVARHADQGPIALALIARHIPAELVFDIDGVAAAQEIIVPLDGKSQISPRERPGADLKNPELRRPNTPALGGLGNIGAR